MPKSHTESMQGQEARILLTNTCNYRCIFCHGEGVGDVSRRLWKPDEEATLDAVNQALSLGCRDLTLTGGEPLLQRKMALRIIEHVGRCCPDAEVTIVSNLSLLKQEWLARASAYRNLRLNVSLHSADPDEYQRVTGQRQTAVQDITQKLAWLRPADVPFKLNCVALKSLVEGDHLARLCSFAETEGALSLKILELLIMENCETLFPSFLSLASVAKLLPAHFEFAKKHPRRDEYESPKSNLRIELQKCRCRFGCRDCLTNRTAHINSRGAYWPCFEGANAAFDINDGGLDQALQAGKRVLGDMAARYGDMSPALIKDIRYTRRKLEAFFKVEDLAQCRDLIENSEKTEMKSFTETYFAPVAQPGTIAHQAKIRCHDGDPENALLILSSVWLEKKQDVPMTAQQFLQDQPLPFRTRQVILDSILAHLGWRPIFAVHLEGSFYRLPDGSELSICELTGIETILRVACDTSEGLALAQRLRQISGLTPIAEPLPEYLQSCCARPDLSE